MQFRAAGDADTAGVAGVYLAARKRYLAFAPLAHSDDEVREWVRQVLIPQARVTVAVERDEIVGMMAISEDDAGIGWIDHLYLAPEAVGRGVGSRLLTRALDVLRRPVRLYTFQENAGARRFYERHGFEAIAFGGGSANEEGSPDVLYERRR